MTPKILSLTALLALPILVQAPADLLGSSQRARSQLHYRTVVEELRGAPIENIAPETAASRARLIDELERYGERAIFGVAPPGSDGRPATFVDSAGRRCAVAELLHASGRDDLVERVRVTNNGAWVAELAGDPELVDWLHGNGLTLFEAARIQLPPDDWSGGPDTGSRNGASSGLVDRVDSAPGADASAPRSPSAAGTASPGGPSGPASAPTTSSATQPPAATEDAWWLWWEFNKAQFLRPQRISLRSASGGDDAREAFDAFLARHRSTLVEAARAGLADADANVRGAALLALGRVGGADAVERIVAALADPSQTVRHRAIVALGTSGTPQALRPLTSLIRTGTVDGKTRVSPVAEPLAILGAALGRSRANGFPSEMDAIVKVRVRERSGSDREPVGCAAMVYQALAPSASLEELAFELARDERESIPVRCRAIEALRHSRDERALPTLQSLLVSARLDLRRSAALALGEVPNPLALAALMTASEIEAESLTRGFVLVSIGRRGGERAREFLLAELRKGPTTHRPWCALGLGLVARGSDAADVAGELRAAFARERYRQAEGAYCIAFGLARDPRAVPLLAGLVSKSGNAQTRAYAATALGLIDESAAHAALAAYVDVERQPQARVTAAFALASMGDAGDFERLRGVLEDMRDPELRTGAASALAFHGSLEALDVLERAANASREPSAARAAAIDGLGVMLAPDDPYRLGEAGRQSNHTRMPDWLRDVLALSL